MLFTSSPPGKLKTSMPASATPQHVAIIMDGNRRWARQHGLEMMKGHEKVAEEVIEKLSLHAIKRGVSYLTLWAFSTENWHRSQQEVGALMDLFRKAFTRSAEQLHKNGIRLQTIGDLSLFPADIQQNIAKWIELTAPNDKLTVSFALNYGGRDEITRAVRQIVKSGVTAAAVTPELLSANLDTATIPDPDFIIRPGGELRLSGYLPWQSVYSELYFTDTLMPDFEEAAFDAALAEYARRQRRFGA